MAGDAQALLRHYLKTAKYLPRETEAYYYQYKFPLTPVEEGYGYIGALARDETGNYVQCHICGYFMAGLSTHIKKHGLSAYQYKQKYGLLVGTPLLGGEVASNMKAIQRGVMTPERATELRAQLDEIRTVYTKGSTWAPERRNKEGNCLEQTAKKISDLASALGRTPTRRQFISVYGDGALGNVLTHFGSWNNAILAIGLEPNGRGYALIMEK